MSEQHEAAQIPTEVDVPAADLEQIFGDGGQSTEGDDLGQAESAKTLNAGDEAEAKPEGAASDTPDPVEAFEWADDNERAVLAGAIEGNTLPLTPEVLEVLRRGGMMRRGFTQRMEELSEKEKDWKAQVDRARQLEELFSSQEQQDRYIQFMQNEASTTDAPDEIDVEFSTDAEIAKYVREASRKEAERLLAERDRKRGEERKQASAAQEEFESAAHAAYQAEFSDLNEEEWQEACKSLAKSLNALGINATSTLNTPLRFASALETHAERVRLNRKVSQLNGARESAKRVDDRAVKASSAPTRVATDTGGHDMSTREGRLAALMEYDGEANITD